MLDIDWLKLFVPSSSLAEIFVRGTVVYLALFLAMRLLPRRAIGSVGAVVLGWATLVDFLDYKLPSWNIGAAKPVELIRDGKMVQENLAREHIPEDEVMSQLRRHGLGSATQVAVAYLEGDGHMSVIVKGGTPLKTRGQQ
jgi:uncharacterized membrane protein YcaP (DUF421 family)